MLLLLLMMMILMMMMKIILSGTYAFIFLKLDNIKTIFLKNR